MGRRFRLRRRLPRWAVVGIFATLAAGLVLGLYGAVNQVTPHSSQDAFAASSGEITTDGENAGPVVAPQPVPPPALRQRHQSMPRPPGRPEAQTLVPDFALPPVSDGMVPVLTRIPTGQKVVFLTIDDGAYKNPREIELLRDNHMTASLFLSAAFISDNPGFFQGFVAAGSKVEDHTISHPLNLTSMSYAQQKAEICQMADFEQSHYGRRPVLFRPPGGPYTNVTRRAAADCGLKALVDWEAKANAGGMDYQYGKSLRPGDIVLMHFRPEFAADFQAFLTAQKAAGLQVVLLEDYLQTG